MDSSDRDVRRSGVPTKLQIKPQPEQHQLYAAEFLVGFLRRGPGLTTQHCGIHLTTDTGSNVNSGERMWASGYTMGGDDDSIGFQDNLDGQDWTFDNSSADYLDIADQCTSNCRYSKITRSHGHLEHLRRGIAEYLGYSYNQQFYALEDEKYVATANFYYIAGATPVTQGTGYSTGEIITLPGGGTLLVASLTADSGVASVSIQQGSEYAAVPGNPVEQLSSSGHGTGATFNLAMLHANDRPNMALIRGMWSGVTLSNFEVSYENPSNAAANGMFMLDANVASPEVHNVTFLNWMQLISNRLLLNDDPYFNSGALGHDLVSQPMGGWTVTEASNMTAVVDNTQVLSALGAKQSVKFTATGAGGYYVMHGNPMNVRPGQKLLADSAYFGGTSSGCRVSLRFLFISSNPDILSTDDGDPFGDLLSDVYGETTDPAYTGDQNWWAKMNYLRGPNNGSQTGVVPPSYDTAELEVTVSSCSSTTGPMWLGFAGTNSLN